jgi:hypothetical protein
LLEAEKGHGRGSLGEKQDALPLAEFP